MQRADQMGAGREVGGVEQARRRHRDEILVRHVEVAVGEGELERLGKGVQAVGRAAEARHVEMLEDAQGLPT